MMIISFSVRTTANFKDRRSVIMRISDVSKKYNISSAALRYYEQIGLMPHADRSQTGIREYGQKDCAELEFILRLKNMNMPLKDIKEYLTLNRQTEDAQTKRKALLIRYKDKLNMQISTLQSSLESLNYLISEFDEPGAGARPAVKQSC